MEIKKYKYSKRKRQDQRQLYFTLIGILCVMGVTGLLNMNYSGKENIKETANEAKTEETIDVKVKEEQVETSKERLERVRREAKAKKYPNGVIRLLDKNANTVDFVEQYDEKKDLPPAKTIGDDLVKGQIPHLLQWDQRWGYAPYGTSNVAVSGCGPTCLSMVAAGLTGDASLTPARLAAYGTKKGYVDKENNTYWKFMSEGLAKWKIDCYESDMEKKRIITELKAGNPIILSVGPGDFTKMGHFIVLTGCVDGKIKLNDPFSQENTEKLWKFERIAKQTKAAWVYSRKK